MKPLAALLTALTLVSTSSAFAAPKKKIADKPDAKPLPDIAPIVVDIPKSAPEPAQDPCAEVLTIFPHDERFPVDLTFRRLAGPAKSQMSEAKKVATDIGVEVTASKRRLFMTITGQMTTYNPSGGQTGYYARQRPAKLLDIPVGCEIASVTRGTGAIQDVGPVAGTAIKVLGTGLVEGATCKHVGPSGLPVCGLTLGKVEVRLRPAQTTCNAFEIQPTHIMGPVGLVSEAGDSDFDGDRINLDLQVAVVGHKGRVSVKTSLTLEQVSSDHTRYAGATQDDLFLVEEDAPGCRLKGTFRRDGRIRLTTPANTDEGPEMYTPISGAGGVLKHASCYTDTPGMENTLELGCGLLAFEPIVVQLLPANGPKGNSALRKRIAGQ